MTGVRINHLDKGVNCTGRKQARSFFGPFDKTNVIAVEAIFNASANRFLLIFQAVKIDMKDHSPLLVSDVVAKIIQALDQFFSNGISIHLKADITTH